MPIERIRLKNDAKAAVAAASNAKLVTIVFLIITYVLNLLYGKVIGDKLYEWMEAVNSGYLLANVDISALAVVLGLLISIMSTLIGYGYESYALLISRRCHADNKNLFDAFAHFFRFIWLNILIFAFTYLWTMLFIIPGIIAAYRYRMAIFIILDDPNVTALQAIRRSKELMRGHKWELFVLDLSFIGWEFLCALTLGILYIWKLPYMRATYACFYNTVCGWQPDGEPEPLPGTDNPPWEL